MFKNLFGADKADPNRIQKADENKGEMKNRKFCHEVMGHFKQICGSVCESL